MKAREGDGIITTAAVPRDFGDGQIPAGTRGTVVEVYERPMEGYAVDLAIPDRQMVGGFRFENVVLRPEQFELDAPAA